jgi:methylamine methyltransferase corrinoid protein reductive activase
MSRYGIALDLGTSGFRAQAMDLDDGDIVSTAITIRHPLPGANVIDHVNFAIEAGESLGNRLIIDTINHLIAHLKIDLSEVIRLAVCGNPFQLSLFQNIEIRDLAYAGKRKLERLGVVQPKRDGDVVAAKALGLDVNPDAEVLIPPAVSHEIGADALAMLLLTGAMKEKEPCLVIDYGTNAEMALIVDGQVFTGSAAAGPALEGQEIERGMLAAPGALSDIMVSPEGWSCAVLDECFIPRDGDLVDPVSGYVQSVGTMHGRAKGITGTGVIATISSGMDQDIIKSSKIRTSDRTVHLQDGLFISEKDVSEAGKAIGAIRAGYLTLMEQAGIAPGDLKTTFMSGATGIYVDAIKAQRIGLVPADTERIVQIGNTSLLLANQLVRRPEMMDDLRSFATELRASHCMFATSEIFKNIYSIELSLWSYAMPMSMYNEMLDIYKLNHISLQPAKATTVKMMERDIQDLGRYDICIITDIGVELKIELTRCIGCGKCSERCPEAAISIISNDNHAFAIIRSERCSGTACRRCEMACPAGTLHLKDSKINIA